MVGVHKGTARTRGEAQARTTVHLDARAVPKVVDLLLLDRIQVAQCGVEQQVTSQALKDRPAAAVAVGAVARNDGRVRRGREARDAAKDALGEAAARVEVAVGRLQVVLDGAERVRARLDKLPDVVGLRVGGARQLARGLGRLKVPEAMLVVGDPRGEAAERVANGARRRIEVEKKVARRVRDLAVGQLL